MRYLLFAVLFINFLESQAQQLHPGFNKQEYIKLMQLSSRQIDTPWVNPKFPIPDGYQLIFRSPVLGLDNR